MYRIDGRDVLLDWLAGESDPQRRLGMLEWMAELAAEPLTAAHRVPSIRPSLEVLPT